MNIYQQKSCLEILNKLAENPCYRMFSDPPTSQPSKECQRPLYLNFIKSKLEVGMYDSTREFVFDVRTVFRNVEKSNSCGEYKKLGAKLLFLKFEEMIANGHITQSELDCNLFVISNEIKNLEESIQKPPPNSPKTKEMPASFILHEKVDVPTTKQLQAALRILNEPSLIIQAAIFALEKQKGCVSIGQTIDFHFRIMKSQTKIDLYTFIINKLKEVAVSGKK
ncbi:hypothetical protein TRFO_33908 [Tritrichomonas foetus]|uniref:Bromo domain-containing protein n=1 Tax=Tritrichomonas foetus TaxID=1144522 RepID=A0A1J4JKC4_9EUKA|nr:hypothetical protein TRFO_33908 [Tritrichomonas foetus]|eukprot:OHS99584.1 hypothetical protein TRFO_33908 [Tritrichomonas foetus]